jgi:hypothetical protein
MMKALKQATRALLLTALASLLLVAFAAAESTGTLWVELTETASGTTAAIVTDAATTDGLIELTYDSSALTVKEVTVNDAYVAQYAVNAEEDGVVRISWVAPQDDIQLEDGDSLIQVVFDGSADEDDVALTETSGGYTADGTVVPVGTAPADDNKGDDAGDNTGDDATKPDDSTDTGDTSADKESSNTTGTAGAKTGDNSAIVLAACLGVVACIALGALVVVYKRRGAK